MSQPDSRPEVRPDSWIIDGDRQASTCCILAHGAGAGMDSPFMETIAHGLARSGLLVVRFEFPYMARRRLDGSKRPPDRLPVLLEYWRQVVQAVRQQFSPARLVVGGKSMGGRVASLVAEECQADGLVVLGYPFHPAGKPLETGTTGNMRTAHLSTLTVPALFCQGERDSLGSRDSLAGLVLSPAIRLLWLPDGDHSLKPRKSSGVTLEHNMETALQAIVSTFGNSRP